LPALGAIEKVRATGRYPPKHSPDLNPIELTCSEIQGLPHGQNAVLHQGARPSLTTDGSSSAPRFWSRCALPWSPLFQAAPLISTFFACAGAGLGTVTLSTPFAMVALIAFGSTPSGWMKAETKKQIEIHSAHWRDWTEGT
jgi:hypothetical protein